MKYLIDSYKLIIISDFVSAGVNPELLKFKAWTTRASATRYALDSEQAYISDSEFFLTYSWIPDLKCFSIDTCPNIFGGVQHIGYKRFGVKAKPIEIHNCVTNWSKLITKELVSKNRINRLLSGKPFDKTFYGEENFTPYEIVQISVGITLLEERFKTLKLPEHQLIGLLAAVNELRKDAERLNKKDFLVFTLGTITNVIISYGFSSNHSQLIWESVKHFLMSPTNSIPLPF